MLSAAPTLSVIVPVYNSVAQLRRCLDALRPQLGSGDELIVVDDASTDDLSAALGGAVTLLTQPRNGGPAAARNRGARSAGGRVLLFVDADVVAADDALARVRRLFAADRRRVAAIGSYDDAPEGGVVSRYRNLLHHYVHQTAPPQVSHFWTGLGAVRRRVFCALGGLDEGYRAAAIEDVEFGYRLRERGLSIDIDKALQGKHLKRWTLRSMIVTDVKLRALPWLRLLRRRGGVPDDLSIGWRPRLSVALAGATLATAAAALLGAVAATLPVALLTAFVALNAALLAFFYRRGGAAFALACVPLHLLYHCYTGAAAVYVLAFDTLRGRR